MTSVDADIFTEPTILEWDRLPNNGFSVEWTGYIYIPKTGDYTFFTKSDDGSWLFIDETLVVDNGGIHKFQEVQGDIHLTKGIHRITIRYFQVEEYLILNVLWTKNLMLETPIPTKFLLPPDTDLRDFGIYRLGETVLRYFIVFCFLIVIGKGIVRLLNNGIIALRKHPYNIVVLLFFLIFLLVGVSILDDYGISWDERTQRDFIGMISYKYISEGYKELFSDSFLEKYYGTVFEILLIFIEDKLELNDLREIYLMRHFITFLLFYVSVFFFYLLCKHRFCNWKIGLLGSVFLILSPRIFAHSFYNTKDLPFLSVFIISIYTLVLYLDQKTRLRILLHALCCGLLFDIRIIGIIVPCLTFLFTIGEIVFGSQSTRIIKKTAISLLYYSLLLIVFTVLFWPILWENPLYHFYQAFVLMRLYPWNNTFLYLGNFVSDQNIPWHYIPVWILITTPIFYVVNFLVGILVSGISFGRRSGSVYSNKQKREDAIWLLWLFLPICAVILLKSVVYDAWRHLFFVYPAFLIISLYGLVSWFRWITSIFKGRMYKIVKGTLILIIFLSLFSPVYFMIQYHPHQNVYFNRFAGKDMKSVKNNFELDYWGLSYRQALKYILQHDTREQVKIYVTTKPGKLAAMTLKFAERKRILYVDTPDDADYFVSNYRWHKGEYPYNNEFYSIRIGGAKIMVVYDLRN